jgi:HPt (histidine-containing phosphotransfer) domain-containing protein
MEKNTELYDLSFLLNFTKGDPEKVEKYIRTYLRTSETIFAGLEQAGREGRWEEAYSKAHTVKPQVQYMGISSLLEVIMEIETRAKSDPGAASLADLVAKAMDLYKSSSAGLNSYLQGGRG